jgi:dihydropteroate synthase
VAAAAMAAGADLINDISGFNFDPEMARVAQAICRMGTHQSVSPSPVLMIWLYLFLRDSLIVIITTSASHRKKAALKFDLA